jgi:hypothetical protein
MPHMPILSICYVWKLNVASMLRVSSLSEFWMSQLYSDWMEFLNSFQAQ